MSWPHRKPGTGQWQSDIRGSTLTPCAAAAKPTALNACQGTSPPSRRHLTMLQGPSRGEEDIKKLLAIGSAAKAKPCRPQGTGTKACLWQGVARARAYRRATQLLLAANLPHRSYLKRSTFCCRRIARLAPAPANFSPSSRSGSLVRARNGVATAKPRNWCAPLTPT